MKAKKPEKRVLKPVLIDVPEDHDPEDPLYVVAESAIRRLIAEVFVKMDATYVRKSELKRELELAMQEMVKNNITAGESK